MAFIPDDAIDRMAELSAGAWRLYCFLARCRNQRDGRCHPSLHLTMETIGTKRRQTFELRKELAAAGWATFDGNTVSNLLGFDSAKNRTPDIEVEEVTQDSAENRTTLAEEVETSAKNRTVECDFSHSGVRFFALACKEEPAKEPAKRTSKGIGAKRAPPDPRVSHVAIQAVRGIVERYPPKAMWDKLITVLGDEPNTALLVECRTAWVERGYNANSWIWATEWYLTGVPQRGINNGTQTNKTNPARTTEEYGIRDCKVL